MRIMDIGWTIDAQSDRHIVIADKSAPGFVDQSPVGLHTMPDDRSCRRFSPNFLKRLLVIRDRDRQRLSGMPDHRQRAQNQVGRKDFLNRRGHNLQRHPFLRSAIREIAIVAVDVTKRRRLKDEQTDPRSERILRQRSIQKGISLTHPVLRCRLIERTGRRHAPATQDGKRLPVTPIVPVVPIMPAAVTPTTVTPTAIAPARMPIVPSPTRVPIVPVAPPHRLSVRRRGIALVDSVPGP